MNKLPLPKPKTIFHAHSGARAHTKCPMLKWHFKVPGIFTLAVASGGILNLHMHFNWKYKEFNRKWEREFLYLNIFFQLHWQMGARTKENVQENCSNPMLLLPYWALFFMHPCFEWEFQFEFDRWQPDFFQFYNEMMGVPFISNTIEEIIIHVSDFFCYKKKLHKIGQIVVCSDNTKLDAHWLTDGAISSARCLAALQYTQKLSVFEFAKRRKCFFLLTINL